MRLEKLVPYINTGVHLYVDEENGGKYMVVVCVQESLVLVFPADGTQQHWSGCSPGLLTWHRVNIEQILVVVTHQ